MINETEKTNIDFENFDLEIDESAPKATPRIHVAPGDSSCTSCEG